MTTPIKGGSASLRVPAVTLSHNDYRSIRRFDADLLNVRIDGAGGPFAVLHRVDHARVTAETGGAAWFSAFTTAEDGTIVRSVEVVPHGSLAPVVVARIVAGASEGTTVRYRDGDPLNLTLSNIEIVPDVPVVTVTNAARSKPASA